MLYAVLLLGLLPLALFPDGSEVEPEEESGDNIADEVIAGPGDLLEETGDDPTDESADDTDLDDVLQPSDEIDVSDGTDEDPDDILAPVDEDDGLTPSDGEEGDILEPVDEDDVAVPANALDFEKPNGSNIEDIEAFDVTSDILCLYLDDDTESIVSANLSDDGEDTEIYLGNELVAVLRGVTDPTQVEITAAVDAAA